MRDPVIYRYVDIPHNRTGNTFNVYPIYNFSCPVVDSLEGVTHALRSNEYHDSEEQYYWFLENIPGLRPVKIKDFSRVNFTYTLLSKRKLQWFVDEHIVDGWNDPRFPTVQGMTRRGLRVEALKEFILDLGDSKNTGWMDINKLWAINKKFIDKIIPRYTAVRKDNIVILELDGPASPIEVEVARHRENPSLGTKRIIHTNRIFIEQEDAQELHDNEEITLMDWGNAIVTKITKDNNLVTGVRAELHLEGDFKNTNLRLTWLPATPANLVELRLIEYDSLITVPKIPGYEKKKYTNYANRNSKLVTLAYGEANLKELQKGDQFQLSRIGYFMLDSEHDQVPMVLVLTPDGHLKNKFLSKKVAERKS